ncbi:DUF6090 family protein [Robiginitalea aurantiaca]|uniref:DUF6090 family protein n=1 Tax=Robiginitalea aurantiaca TaxID=3056915 RepID=A0ABT7WBL1_9FLAO|nr:DUF6090 family protein [Robiginitalea aurantiaca]MDM9630306.1 DUF6090 family protein [Robiginitalea aurantiaca]
MINFFRKIRKQLADQNKPLKYFRYALGEIVLVMIGILLALQVNNWNEARKDQQELKNILQSITADMKVDAQNMKWASESHKEDNERIKSFLNHEDYSGFTRDSLEQSLEIWYILIDYRMNSYYMLRDSGITEFGRYADAVTEIKVYYDLLIPEIKSYEEDIRRSVQESEQFWLLEQNTYEFIKGNELRSQQSDEAALTALTRLLKSPIPRNILKTSFRNNKKMMSQYDWFGEYIDEEVKEIEDVLRVVD